MFEEGFGGFESQSTCTASDWRQVNQRIVSGRLDGGKRVSFVPCGGVHVLIALPLTWNLYAILCAAVRFSGGG